MHRVPGATEASQSTDFRLHNAAIVRIPPISAAISTYSVVFWHLLCDDRRVADRTPRVQQLDDISRAIVEHLQADGRRSYADIGKAVGLSETAVRNRVQRLVDAGVMQIVAVTDPLQLGFARQAMVGIRTSGDSTRIAEEVSALPEVTYVVLTAGSFDVLAEVVCASDDELIDLLNRRIRAIDGVVATESFVYLRLVKQLYDWGTQS